MRVFLKIHESNSIETVACCDEQLLNKVFIEGDLRIEISKQFFGGALVNIDDAIELLKNALSFNIIGENITNKAVKCNIIPKEVVQEINNIPMALKMIF